MVAQAERAEDEVGVRVLDQRGERGGKLRDEPDADTSALDTASMSRLGRSELDTAPKDIELRPVQRSPWRPPLTSSSLADALPRGLERV